MTKLLSREVPQELKELEPLLEQMDLRWSDHYWPSDRPDSCWCLVRVRRRPGAAGRVGMTAREAREHVLAMVAGRLRDCNDALAATRLALLEAADKLGREIR